MKRMRSEERVVADQLTQALVRAIEAAVDARFAEVDQAANMNREDEVLSDIVQAVFVAQTGERLAPTDERVPALIGVAMDALRGAYDRRTDPHD